MYGLLKNLMSHFFFNYFIKKMTHLHKTTSSNSENDYNLLTGRETSSNEFGFLPSGMEFKTDKSECTFTPEWNGPCLFMEITSDDPEFKKMYIKAIRQHNANVTNFYPDSGFDLLLPDNFNPKLSTEKIDFQIKTAMFGSLNSCIANYGSSTKDFLSFNLSKPMPFYLYPRSSISKTNVRLANNVGIIDCGYRGNIGAYFDVRLNDRKEIEKNVLTKYQRVIQICSNNLSPFKVILVKNINSLGKTSRGDRGFGSTGL